jgi:serine/threonine-protein kinase RsbW
MHGFGDMKVPDCRSSTDPRSLCARAEEPMREVTLPNDLEAIRQFQEEVEQALHRWHYTERDIFSIRLALEEALINAYKHGNQADPSKRLYIRYRLDAERFDIDICDEGAGFNPDEVPDPLDVENLERPCGRGLLLMRHYMTEVVFHPPGNRVFLSKRRSVGAECNGHA